MDFAEIREAIDDVVDMRDIAVNLLGLSTRTIGGRTQILCPLPDHNDHEFGSCILNDKWGYCFACNEGFNAIDLVINTENCSFIDAVRKIADFYGLNLDLFSDSDPVEPLIIPSEVFRFAGITDTAGFKKLFEDDRETAFRYLSISIATARNKYKTAAKDTALPIEVTKIIQHRMMVLAKADNNIAEWRRADPDRPLRITK